MESKTVNTVIICSDQHNPHMTGYRGHFVDTPNIDRLAAEGCSFNRAYCNSPLCTPSRMSFITGKYPHQIRVWGFDPLSPDEMTWARRLDENGIESIMVGKMDFCGEYQDGGFSRHHIIRRRTGRTLPYDIPPQSRLEGTIISKKREFVINAGIRPERIISDGNWGDEEDACIGNWDHDRMMVDHAKKILHEKANERNRKSWCLYLGLFFPHYPFRVPKRFFNRYYTDNIDLPHDYSIPNGSLHPAIIGQQYGQDMAGIPEERLRRCIATYYGMISCLDEWIGEILTILDTTGMAKNTTVIYLSDHGEQLGEHGIFYKQNPYEGSVGIPLVMRGPGIEAGRDIDSPVSLVDLYPTIMDLYNLKIERELPGYSWLPEAQGVPSQRTREVFAEYHWNFYPQGWFSLIDRRYKYVYHCNRRSQLFDLLNDPHELRDLANKSDYTEILIKMEQRLRSICNPDEISRTAKSDQGLITLDGTDLTKCWSQLDWEKSYYS